MATRGIDYGKLTLRDALDLALLIEEEARDRYEDFADQMEACRSPEAEAFFRKMVRSEEAHRAALEKRRTLLFGREPAVVTRAQLFQVEAPDLAEVRSGLTARQALETALRSETKAHDFFVAALPKVKDPQVKKLFEELKNEETAHRQWVQAELDKRPAYAPAS